MVREKAKTKREDRDSYPTPHWCIDVLAERLERFLPQPDWVVDLGAGDGRIGVRVQEKFRKIPNVLFIDIVRDPVLSHEYGADEYLVKDARRIFDEGRLHDIINTGDDPERVLYVSNPPFGLAQEFRWRAVEYVKTVHAPGSACAFLLRMSMMGSKDRAEWNNRYPPDAIIVLAPRPSFVRGATDNSEYSWHVWIHGRHQGTQMEVVLRDQNGLKKAKKKQGKLL